MVRSELIHLLTEHSPPHLTQSDVERAVAVMLERIVIQLVGGGRTDLRRFGVFEARRRKARDARNSSTGEPVAVDAKNVPFFRPSKDLAKRLNNPRDPGEPT